MAEARHEDDRHLRAPGGRGTAAGGGERAKVRWGWGLNLMGVGLESNGGGPGI